MHDPYRAPRLVWVPTSDALDAYLDDRLVGSVVHGRSYTVHSVDGAVSGSHHTLESAQAELAAWVRWCSEVS